jgi:hypothetical protein
VTSSSAFIDETTAKVAEARNKFEHHGDLVDAFNGDPTATGYAAAIARADKFEARLIAARARDRVQQVRRNRRIDEQDGCRHREESVRQGCRRQGQRQ